MIPFAIGLFQGMKYLAAGGVMIGVLVVIHEFGHFLFAKLFGVDVPVFSVGMGPRLFGIKYRGTDYRVALLPVGGYVQMSGADPFGEEDAYAQVDPEHNFMHKPIWQRLIIMFAGPAFNLILPFVVFTAVMMAGEPQAPARLGVVLPEHAAEQLGFRTDDLVLSVNGLQVASYGEFYSELRDHRREESTVVVARNGVERTLNVPAEVIRVSSDGLVDAVEFGTISYQRSSRIGVAVGSPAARAGLQIGDLVESVDGQAVQSWKGMLALLTAGEDHTVTIKRVSEKDRAVSRESLTLEWGGDYRSMEGDTSDTPWGILPAELFVGAVEEGSPAERAQLQVHDRIWRVDGLPMRTWIELPDLVSRSMIDRTEAQGPRPVKVELVRDGELVETEIVPKITRRVMYGEVEYVPILGVLRYPSSFVDYEKVKVYYSFTEAVPKAFSQGWRVFKGTVGVLGKITTFEIKPQEGLGGPVAIFRMAGKSAEGGLHQFARMLGTISFSLGIVNLLPIPVLDGGQILFYLLEAIRGRPLSLELRERIQMVGVLGMVALMLMVTVMDISKLFGG